MIVTRAGGPSKSLAYGDSWPSSHWHFLSFCVGTYFLRPLYPSKGHFISFGVFLTDGTCTVLSAVVCVTPQGSGRLLENRRHYRRAQPPARSDFSRALAPGRFALPPGVAQAGPEAAVFLMGGRGGARLPSSCTTG